MHTDRQAGKQHMHRRQTEQGPSPGSTFALAAAASALACSRAACAGVFKQYIKIQE